MKPIYVHLPKLFWNKIVLKTPESSFLYKDNHFLYLDPQTKQTNKQINKKYHARWEIILDLGPWFPAYYILLNEYIIYSTTTIMQVFMIYAPRKIFQLTFFFHAIELFNI